MRTYFVFGLLAVALASAAAQTPPSRPKAARTPPRAAPAIPPVAPRAVRAPQPPAPPAEWHEFFGPDLEFEMPAFHLNEPLPPMDFHMELPNEIHLESLSEQLALLEMEPPMHFWPGDEAGSRGRLSRIQPEQGSPEDSLYRSAKEALNRGEYARASTLFQTVEQKYPRSRVAPAAMYWRAFALYRAGSTEELRVAIEALKAQQQRYPESASDADAATLRTRLYAALAARGDAKAAAELRTAAAAGTDCDREDMEVRSEALSALAQLNPPEARATLKKVLARRDECSVTLRRRAVYILGRTGTDESATDLLDVAKTDPDPGVRSDAINMLGRAPGATTVKVLEQIFNESSDERTRQAVLSALRSRSGPDAKSALRRIIDRSDLPERMRAEAISQLAGSSMEWKILMPGQVNTTIAEARRAGGGGGGDEEDAAYLRGLYGKTDSRTVKSAIISAVARIGGSEQWLLGIAKNREEDTSLRREALSRIKTTSLSVDELGKLFDALSERELRSAVVNQLANRQDSAATDKLIEIARSGTDPQLRRMAIAALAKKNDPRTTKLLLDLLEKP